MSRSKIMDAAVGVFAEKGYHQASMDEIALRAGVAKGTLYYHFTGKSELFKTIVSDGLQQLMTKIDKDLKGDPEIERQIRNIVGHHIDLFLESNGLAHIVMHELTNGLEEEVLAELNRLRESYVDYLAGVLEEGRKWGILRDVDCKLAATGLLGLLDSSCEYFLRNKERVKREQIETFVLTTVMKGIVVK